MMAVTRRLIPALLGALALVAGVLTVQTAAAAPASADSQYCWMQPVQGPNGTISYVKKCRTIHPGEPGGPGGTGHLPSPADCGLDKGNPGGTGAGYGAFYCVGSAACTIKDNWVPYAPPTEPAPAGHEWKLQLCWPCGTCLGPPSNGYVLDGPRARPLIIQAQEAFGRLAVTHGEPAHSPKTAAVVGLTTWFWLDPGLFGEERGTSAEGLVAIATPASTTWDPGDGSGTITCAGPGRPYAGSEDAAGACTHTYAAMSPDYHGQVTRHWTVRYENNGAPIDIPGADLALDLADDFDLTVVETQVIDNRGGN
jgi:hypothetical protein